MKALIAACLACILPSVAEEAPPPINSPDKNYAVVTVPGNATRSAYYVIQNKATARSLGTCPDDFRFEATPSKVIWNADSRWVAIETRMTRHGGHAEVWKLNGQKATLLKAAYPAEAGNFYFSPTRWLNATDLEFDVIGMDEKAPDRDNPVKMYRLVMRMNSKKGAMEILTAGKPSYRHF